MSVINRARALVGHGQYDLHAKSNQAPRVVNCHEFVRWVFKKEHGLHLPDRLRSAGEAIPLSEVCPADILIVRRSLELAVEDDWGHVGLVTEDETVIQATHRYAEGVLRVSGIVEETLEEFLQRDFLDARRVVAGYSSFPARK